MSRSAAGAGDGERVLDELGRMVGVVTVDRLLEKVVGHRVRLTLASQI